MESFLEKIFANKSRLLLLVFMFAAMQAWATTNSSMQVIGLFKNKIVAVIDGQQQVLKIGDTTSEGFTLVEATSDGAVFEHNGKKTKYNLSMQINSSYKTVQPGKFVLKTDKTSQGKEKTSGKVIKIELDQDGQYITTIKINGAALTALVDTGANTISLSSNQAKQLHINYTKGRLIKVNTASGATTGYSIEVDEVTLGDITKTKVAAVVLEGEDPKTTLLGMSFLGRVSMKFDEKTKTLEISE